MSEMGNNDFYENVNALMKLYVTSRDRFVMAMDERVFVPKDPDGKYRKLTNYVVMSHLNQRYAIGVFAPPVGSRFICFDIDSANKELVRKVQHGLIECGIPEDYIYVSLSGGKGYHVEVFFTDLIYSGLLRNLYNCVVSKEGLDPTIVEFRPTNTQAIKIPLSIHHKTRNVCWYVDPFTLKPIEDYNYIQTIRRLERNSLENLLKQLPRCALPPASPSKKYIPLCSVSEETCAIIDDSFPMMTGPGMRHSLMLQIARYERARGKDQRLIEEELVAWAKKQNASYITDTWRTVMDDAASLAAWVWGDDYIPFVRKIQLTDNDIMALLQFRPSKLSRKVYFIIMLYTLRFGNAKMSAQRIANNVGGSAIGVVKVLQSLEENGFITKKKGRIKKNSDGSYSPQPNTYVHNPVSYIEEGNRKTIEVTWDFSPETFNDFYLDTICKYTDHSTWAKYFTTTEIKELQEFERKDSL